MAVTNEQISAYLAANPGMSDADIAAAMNQYGVNPEQMAQATGLGQDVVQSRFDAAKPVAAPLSQVAAPAPTAAQIANTPFSGASLDIMGSSLDGADFSKIDPAFFKGLGDYAAPQNTNSIASTYKNIYGVEPDAATLANLTNQYGNELDSSEIARLVYDDTSLRDDPRGVVKTLQQQILDQNTAKYWSGEAFGSTETTAADMARMLASVGIKDINQFGKVTVAADATVTPVFSYRTEDDGEGGTRQIPTITGYVDANGNPVDQSLVTQQTDAEGGGTGVFTAPVGTKEVFGNKETGVALDPRYDRAQGNIFSGTFAGDGSTGYGVQFKDDGTPVFYTQFGGSTNTVKQIMDDLGPLGQIAFAVATGGLSIPQQIAAQAALSLASGADLKDIAKNIAVSTVMQGLPSSGVIKDGASFLNTIDSSGVLGNAFTSAASSGVKAALTEQDIGDAILSGAIGGGTAGAIDFVAGNIPGFSDLSASQQNMVKNAMSGVTSGQPLDQVLINTAIEAGKNAVRTAVNDKLGETAFVESKRTGATDQEALDASDSLTKIAEANETFDGSSFGTQKEAMNAALAEGKDKFTFGGKRFTIDNSAAQIKDFENSVMAEVKAANDLRAKSDSEWGDLGGAQAAATARNTVAIGNAEANDVNEAAYLAKLRDPSATSFTFDGKTYNVSASQAEMAQATRNASLAEIKDLPNFNDAYARARAALGPNQTFEWNGKQYSTATAAERPDLNITAADKAIEALNAANLANTTDASKTVAAQTDATARIYGSAEDQSAAETARLRNLNTGLDLAKAEQAANDAKAAINSLLGEGTASTLVLQGLSNLQKAMGQTFDFFGGVGATTGLAGSDNTLTNIGQSLNRTGQALQHEAITTAGENVISAVDQAKGLGNKLVAGVKAIIENPLSVNYAVVEAMQEAMPISMAAKILSVAGKFSAIGANVAYNAMESGGAARNEAYRESIARNESEEVANANADRKFWIASTVTALTGAAVDTAVVNKFAKAMEKVATKSATTGTKEGGTEILEVLATEVLDVVASGGDLNDKTLDKIFTKTAVEGLVGGKTASTVDVTTGAGNVVTDIIQSDSATTAANTAASTNVANSINTAITSGNTQNIGSVITENVATSLNSGASANVVIDSAIATAITGGADVSSVITNTVAAALGTGAAADTVINSAINSAVTAGAGVGAAVDSAVKAAVTAGSSVTVAVESAVKAVVDSGGSVDGAVEAAVGAAVTNVVNSGGSVDAAVGAAVTGVVNSGGSVTVAVESAVKAVVESGGDVTGAVEGAVTGAVNSGGSVTGAVDSAVKTVIESGGSVTVAVDSAVTAAVGAGASVDASLAAAVSAAVTNNADVNTVVQAATDAAIKTGNNVTVVSDSNVVTITNATTDTNTTVNTNTGVTTTVDNTNNVTTVVDGGTTTVVDANLNTTSQTTVDGSTQTTVVADANTNTNTETVVDAKTNTTTSTTVDTSNKTTTQTTITGDTQTTVLTDANNNTQTTVKVDVNTGEVIDFKEAEIPTEWKQPEIKAPEVKAPEVKPTEPASIPPTAVAEEAVSKASTAKPKKLGEEGGAGGVGGAGLPLGIDVDPASLRSKVTGDAIDPLARVKQAQAELERDVMMNQMDPRFLAAIQQRTNPNQQAQQLDSDVGALAKLLRGDSEAPANEGKYYSYGSEDSIDDILGGMAANYKEGGYVEPLKASGGSMALPLLAKSGGALSHYDGRENFKEGKSVSGPGDGQSDDIPAWLADGEYVLDSELVSALGNGSTKAGTALLDEFRKQIRAHKRKAPLDGIPPKSKSPLTYLNMAKKAMKKK